jgi:hypothetical protein
MANERTARRPRCCPRWCAGWRASRPESRVSVEL